MSHNNVIQFPDKNKEYSALIDSQTNELIVDILDLHGAVGCITMVVHKAVDGNFTVQTYAGGDRDIFSKIVTLAEDTLEKYPLAELAIAKVPANDRS